MKRYEKECRKIYQIICQICNKKNQSTIQNEKTSITFNIKNIIQKNSNELRNEIFKVLKLNYKNVVRHNRNHNK